MVREPRDRIFNRDTPLNVTDADLTAITKILGNKIKVAWVKQGPARKVACRYNLEITRQGRVLFTESVAFSDEAWAQARRNAMAYLQAMLPPPQPVRHPDDNLPLP